MHGYDTFAEYATADTMAGSPAKVMELLESVWTAGKASISRERKELETYIAAHETASTTATAGAVTIEPWDWRYYAEKVRQSQYNIDDSEVKPYFSLDYMLAAIFDVAYNLFGLTFRLREDIEAYHPDVKVYEVYENETTLVAVFLSDNYARQHKRSGAWMSEFRAQYKNVEVGGRDVFPIIINNNNFNKGERDTFSLIQLLQRQIINRNLLSSQARWVSLRC